MTQGYRVHTRAPAAGIPQKEPGKRSERRLPEPVITTRPDPAAWAAAQLSVLGRDVHLVTNADGSVLIANGPGGAAPG